jgi:hypothetical protein
MLLVDRGRADFMRLCELPRTAPSRNILSSDWNLSRENGIVESGTN